ncbi:class I SAM-dependent methyltransferase [Candidatus Woesearchaeota archaeon]|nr:class I SAM-dependent methyltransferase [Candidatus Woesearchaeota archaeon]
MKLKKYKESKKYLTNHYKVLGNFKKDFRNVNLNSLIVSKVKGKKILDIGCGSGHLLNSLEQKGKQTYGIEPNPDLIKLAKNINPNLQIINGYAKDISKFKSKFDTVTIIDVLEHIDDDVSQIKLMNRYLEKFGKLIVVVPCFKLLYGKRDINLGHYRRYTKRELIDKLNSNGFKVKSIRYWNMMGFFPYLFSEKILKKELNTELRTQYTQGTLKKYINHILNLWFKHLENNFNMGFGLSLICVAEKTG